MPPTNEAQWINNLQAPPNHTSILKSTDQQLTSASKPYQHSQVNGSTTYKCLQIIQALTRSQWMNNSQGPPKHGGICKTCRNCRENENPGSTTDSFLASGWKNPKLITIQWTILVCLCHSKGATCNPMEQQLTSASKSYRHSPGRNGSTT